MRVDYEGEPNHEPGALNRHLKPFQEEIVRWALRRGRACVFAQTGLGKTIMQLARCGRPVCGVGCPSACPTAEGARMGPGDVEAETAGLGASPGRRRAGLKLYMVQYDSQQYHVEAPSFGAAVAVWHDHVRGLWGEDYEGDEEPEQVVLVSEDPVVRGEG